MFETTLIKWRLPSFSFPWITSIVFRFHVLTHNSTLWNGTSCAKKLYRLFNRTIVVIVPPQNFFLLWQKKKFFFHLKNHRVQFHFSNARCIKIYTDYTQQFIPAHHNANVMYLFIYACNKTTLHYRIIRTYFRNMLVFFQSSNALDILLTLYYRNANTYAHIRDDVLVE